MLNKELKRLSRRELVDIIYQLKKNEQDLQEEIVLLRNKLGDKEIQISEAGSIAEASINVSNVFSAAQNAADIYLQEIKKMKDDTQKECDNKVKEAEEKVKRVLADGEKKFAELKACYKAEYKKLQEVCLQIQKLKETQNVCEENENG